jgi:hypothetical protein
MPRTDGPVPGRDQCSRHGRGETRAGTSETIAVSETVAIAIAVSETVAVPEAVSVSETEPQRTKPQTVW